MDQTLKATVLMPAYNAEKYIKEAIDSILAQSFSDFEFLIINDGSTDKTKEIIKTYTDPRIRLVNNETNLRLIKTLNKGIDLARGEYIVRMDADDISLPDRLKIQIDYMDKHPGIGISGAWTKSFGNNKNIISKRLTKPKEIEANFLFHTSIAHPTVIMRTNLIKKNKLYYDENFPHSEDRELWSRTVKYFQLSNIPKVLLLYREHNQSVSHVYSDIQKQSGEKTIRKQLAYINLNPDQNEIIIHRAIMKPGNYELSDYLQKSEAWLNTLLNSNKKADYYNESALKKIIQKRWLDICYANIDNNINTWKIFWKSKLSKKSIINFKIQVLKFFIKTYIIKPKLNSSKNQLHK